MSLNNLNPFKFYRTPEIYYGPGQFDEIGKLARKFGKNTIIVTGHSSFEKSNNAEKLFAQLNESLINYSQVTVETEPSPEIINSAVDAFRDRPIELVIAVGGGSVIDAGKAISAMIKINNPVEDYIEGIGSFSHDGTKIPFIAVPTTAGTGSEATKNAVISNVGRNGFKRSLRHDNFVPDVAIVDPVLTLTSSPEISSASGMDALAQLIESYVSKDSSPLTDTLALNGLTAVKNSLIQVCTENASDLDARGAMSYAALISGITISNSGVGVIHGMAGPIGGLFPIPHGIICGRLLAESIKITIKRLFEDKARNMAYLEKFANIGKILSGCNSLDILDCCNELIFTIEKWTKILNISNLGNFGISREDADTISKISSNKNNPVELTREDIKDIVISAL